VIALMGRMTDGKPTSHYRSMFDECIGDYELVDMARRSGRALVIRPGNIVEGHYGLSTPTAEQRLKSRAWETRRIEVRYELLCEATL
jgi:hypothetical protein